MRGFENRVNSKLTHSPHSFKQVLCNVLHSSYALGVMLNYHHTKFYLNMEVFNGTL